MNKKSPIPDKSFDIVYNDSYINPVVVNKINGREVDFILNLLKYWSKLFIKSFDE